MSISTIVNFLRFVISNTTNVLCYIIKVYILHPIGAELLDELVQFAGFCFPVVFHGNLLSLFYAPISRMILLISSRSCCSRATISSICALSWSMSTASRVSSAST